MSFFFCPEAHYALFQVQWEIIHSIYLFQDTTFLDYIRGGLKLHFVVAIDFTTSNGLPNDPNSLHYWDRQRAENPYTVAIRSVGEIFQDYDVGMLSFSFWYRTHGAIFCNAIFTKASFLKRIKRDGFIQSNLLYTSDQYEYTKEHFWLQKRHFLKSSTTYKILFSFISPNYFGTFDDFSDFCSFAEKSSNYVCILFLEPKMSTVQ